jgi:predicted dehydrogenase
LLWHHACHTVDLLHHQTGEVAERFMRSRGRATPSSRSRWT